MKRRAYVDFQAPRDNKAIYRKHRQAIDLIVEYGTASSVVEAIKAEIETLVECEYLIQKPTAVWFLPKALAKLPPGQDMSTWPFMCWCYHARKENQLYMCLQLYQMADPDKRARLVDAIRATRLKLSASKNETTIASARQKLNLNEDGFPDLSDDAVRPLVAALWKKMWHDGEKIVDVVKNFEWG